MNFHLNNSNLKSEATLLRTNSCIYELPFVIKSILDHYTMMQSYAMVKCLWEVEGGWRFLAYSFPWGHTKYTIVGTPWKEGEIINFVLRGFHKFVWFFGPSNPVTDHVTQKTVLAVSGVSSQSKLGHAQAFPLGFNHTTFCHNKTLIN